MNWFTECWKPNFSVRISLFYLLCSVLLLIGPIWAHGGRKDGQGGHNNRKQENYHFHEGPLVGQIFPSKFDGAKALAGIEGNSSIENAASRISIQSQVITQFLPAKRNTCQLISRQGYTLCYNEEHEQAEWVADIITRQQLSQRVSRTDDFRPDPAVHTGSAALADYKRSGFDRGHLAPAASMSWSKNIMSESFFLSNMSPQLPGFNRGIWRKLEEAVREEAYRHEELIVITGPILEPSLPTIGSNRVSIPKAYFKALLDIKKPSIEGIAFLLENKPSQKPLDTFASTIDDLESITGINFFVNLEDNIENQIESSVNMSHWKSIK